MITFDKANNRYRISISFKDLNGKTSRKWFSAKTKKEAKEIESTEILKLKNGADLSSIQFSSAFKNFLDWKAKTKRKTTINFYESAFNHHILPFFSKFDIKNISYADLERQKSTISSDLTLGRRKQIFICLHAFFKFCDLMYSTQLLPLLNRVGNFEKDPNEVTKKEKALHFWTPSEFEKVSSFLRSECEKIDSLDYRFMPNWSSYVFLNILFYCGLRRGEANALKVSDLHDDGVNPYLDINKSITQKAKGIDWLLTDPKNKNSVRCVPIPKNLALILREHISSRLSRLGVADISELYLVGGLKPLSDNTFNEIKIRAEKATFVSHIRTHDLRHSFASVLINNGVTPDVIQKLLGHSSISITLEIYSHLYPKTLTNAISIFDSLTSPIVQKIDVS